MKKITLQNGKTVYEFDPDERKAIANGGSLLIDGEYFEIGVIRKLKVSSMHWEYMHETDNNHLVSTAFQKHDPQEQ